MSKPQKNKCERKTIVSPLLKPTRTAKRLKRTMEIYFTEFVKRDLIVYKKKTKRSKKKTKENTARREWSVNRQTHCVN